MECGRFSADCRCLLRPHGLQLQLGPPPVAPLGVVADGVAGPHADPLGNGPVLLELLGQLRLNPEGLVRRLGRKRTTRESNEQTCT
jgi:hypothetical protein